MSRPITLAEAVEGALATRKEIKSLEILLEEYQGIIESAARSGQHIPLEDPNRDGSQFIARGLSHEVPVIFTSDLLVQSFKEGSEAHAKIKYAAGESFLRFFTPVATFENAHKSGIAFRRAAKELLGVTAEAFITACLQRDKYKLPKSAIKIEWDRARELTKEAANV